jgi:hypothetical protein
MRAAAELFRDVGPALPRRMRRDLDAFIDGCSTMMLARCIALNEDPENYADYVAWRHANEGDSTPDSIGTLRGAPEA